MSAQNFPAKICRSWTNVMKRKGGITVFPETTNESKKLGLKDLLRNKTKNSDVQNVVAQFIFKEESATIADLKLVILKIENYNNSYEYH